jgi:transposase InsO family protein
MPWRETTPMDQKTQFISDYLRQSLSMSELCELYRISRKTGYKMVERYLKQGPSGLEDRSRRPSSSPNQTPSADFKGQFKTGDGIYCYPLTVTDGFSRYLLACRGLGSTSVAESKPVFTRLFKEYGLPRRIRTDNGVPFATNTLARLSSLSAWWVRLGVLPELIEPGKPQQNGRHERMHRTLKAETTRPAATRVVASNASSTTSSMSSTSNDRTKPSTCKLRPRWRMRMKPLSSTCSRKRRRNSQAPRRIPRSRLPLAWSL